MFFRHLIYEYFHAMRKTHWCLRVLNHGYFIYVNFDFLSIIYGIAFYLLVFVCNKLFVSGDFICIFYLFLWEDGELLKKSGIRTITVHSPSFTVHRKTNIEKRTSKNEKRTSSNDYRPSSIVYRPSKNEKRKTIIVHRKTNNEQRLPSIVHRLPSIEKRKTNNEQRLPSIEKRTSKNEHRATKNEQRTCSAVYFIKRV